MATNRPLRIGDNARHRRSGSIILLLLILIAVIGGGFYLLVDSRRTREAEARAFARETIERLAVQHDLRYLHSIVASERTEFNPGRQEEFIKSFRWLGVPQPDWQLTGNVTFQNQFFAALGHFKAILRYPERHATVEMSVSCPHGPWRLNSLGVTWERTPEESDARKR